MSIGPEHRKAILGETLVSTAINSLLPASIIWLAGLAPPDSLVGTNGIAAPMMKAAGLATFVMTLILTPVIHARVRKGTLPRLDWPRKDRGALRLLPIALPLRAASLALLALALLVPLGLVIVALFDNALFAILPLSRSGFLCFNLIFGAIVGIVMTRFVVLPALADGVPE